MKFLAVATFAALTLLGATAAQATVTFAGSWEVDNGPSWTTKPQAYTGQQAAALLFGGLPTDYLISTIDNNTANINDLAWYSVVGYCQVGCVLGVDGGVQFAQNYVSSNSSQGLGLYYSVGNPYNGITDAASAYVSDNASGAKFTNFAFRITGPQGIPEPLTLSLFGAGLVGAAMIRRRKKA